MKATKLYRRSLLLGLLSAALLLGTGCVKRVEKSEKAEEAERWKASLTDSIAALQKQISANELRLDELHDRVGIMLGDFDHVSNPREVNGYLILKGWSGSYPLTSTGLVARITDDEEFELVAALKGGTFTQIAVTVDGHTAQSAVVPHDQALNYRHAGLNTVAFQGAEADSVAACIASDELAPATLSFLDGRTTGTWAIPERNRKMISDTWRLYSCRREAQRLEASLPTLNSKIAAIRRMIDEK